MFQRISQRLGLLSGVAITVLLLLVGTSYRALGTADTQVALLYHDVIPSIEAINGAHNAFLRVRTSALSHIISRDPGVMSSAEQAMNAAMQEVGTQLKAYEKFLDGEKDKALLEEDHRAIDAYLAGIGKAVQLSKDGRKDEAEAAATALRPTALKVIAALTAHNEYNKQGATRDYQATHDAYRTAVTIMMIAAVVGTLLLMWVAFSTYRAVSSKVIKARNEMKRIEQEMDFSQPILMHGNDEVTEIVGAFNSLSARLRDGLSQIRQSSEQVASAAQELAVASTQVRTSSQSQSDSASAMAASVEQVTVSISHVSDRTSEANDLVNNAGTEARTGGDAVLRMVSRVEAIASVVDEATGVLGKLESSGKQIGSVVNVIKEVADQTNLLALNAAIEAARAGEQGRGFAVVADKVRKLAERTAASTSQISQMVADIQMHSGEVVARMAQAAEAMKEGVIEGAESRQAMERIATASVSSHEVVAEIATALREQSMASNTIAVQVERVAQMSEENSRAAESSQALSDQLSKLARSMNQVVATYKL